MFEENGFDALEDFGGLGGVGAGADFEIDLRGRNAHLAKENVGEGFVIVLAGVDEDGIDFRMALHFAHQRSDFGEIGTGPYDVDDFQSAGHEVVKVVRGKSIAFEFGPFAAGKWPFNPKKHYFDGRWFVSQGEAA